MKAVHDILRDMARPTNDLLGEPPLPDLPKPPQLLTTSLQSLSHQPNIPNPTSNNLDLPTAQALSITRLYCSPHSLLDRPRLPPLPPPVSPLKRPRDPSPPSHIYAAHPHGPSLLKRLRRTSDARQAPNGPAYSTHPITPPVSVSASVATTVPTSSKISIPANKPPLPNTRNGRSTSFPIPVTASKPPRPAFRSTFLPAPPQNAARTLAPVRAPVGVPIRGIILSNPSDREMKWEPKRRAPERAAPRKATTQMLHLRSKPMEIIQNESEKQQDKANISYSSSSRDENRRNRHKDAENGTKKEKDRDPETKHTVRNRADGLRPEKARPEQKKIFVKPYNRQFEAGSAEGCNKTLADLISARKLEKPNASAEHLRQKEHYNIAPDPGWMWDRYKFQREWAQARSNRKYSREVTKRDRPNERDRLRDRNANEMARVKQRRTPPDWDQENRRANGVRVQDGGAVGGRTSGSSSVSITLMKTEGRIANDGYAVGAKASASAAAPAGSGAGSKGALGPDRKNLQSPVSQHAKGKDALTRGGRVDLASTRARVRRLGQDFMEVKTETDMLYKRGKYEGYEQAARRQLRVCFEWALARETEIKLGEEELRRMSRDEVSVRVKPVIEHYQYIALKLIPTRLRELQKLERKTACSFFQRGKQKAFLRLFALKRFFDQDNRQCEKNAQRALAEAQRESTNGTVTLDARSAQHLRRIMDQYLNVLEIVDGVVLDIGDGHEDSGGECYIV